MFGLSEPGRQPAISARAVEVAEVLTRARRALVAAKIGDAHDICSGSCVVRDPYEVLQDASADGGGLTKSQVIAALINLQILVPASNVWIVRTQHVIDPRAVQNLMGGSALSLG